VTTTSATERALPGPTPSALALLLGCGLVLAVAGRAMAGVDGGAAWWGLWVIAGGVSFLGSFRSALPGLSARPVGVLWLAAGALAAGWLARHGLLALMQAWADLPVDAPTVPALTLGDLIVLGALFVPSVVIALASRLRSPRPALLLPALLGVVPVLVALVPLVDRGVVPDVRPAPAPDALLAPLALLWITTLPGPGALPLAKSRPLLHHWVPRLVSVATLVGLPMLLLALTGRSLRDLDAVPLAEAAAHTFRPFGWEVGGGLECAVSLVAAQVLLVLCARVASRSLPFLRSGVFPALALAAGLVAAWVPPDLILLGAAITGWGAVLCGFEPDRNTPPLLPEATS